MSAIMAKNWINGFLDIFPEGGDLVNGLVEVKVGKNWGETK